MSLSLRSRQTDWTNGGMKKHRPKAMPSSRWRDCIFAASELKLLLSQFRRRSGELLVEREMKKMDAL